MRSLLTVLIDDILVWATDISRTSQAFCFLLPLAVLSSAHPWRLWTGRFDTYWWCVPFLFTGMPVIVSLESGIILPKQSWTRAELLHPHLEKCLTYGYALNVYLLMNEPLSNNWWSVNICWVNKLVCTYMMCFIGRHHTVQSCIRETQGKGLMLGFDFKCCPSHSL